MPQFPNADTPHPSVLCEQQAGLTEDEEGQHPSPVTSQQVPLPPATSQQVPSLPSPVEKGVGAPTQPLSPFREPTQKWERGGSPAGKPGGEKILTFPVLILIFQCIPICFRV